MEFYSADTEQRETLHRFFVNNSKALTTGVVLSVMLGVSALVGWRYWHNRYNDTMIAASSAWQLINTGFASQIGQLQLDAAQHFTNANDNNYGALISLGLARQYVKKGDFVATQAQLQKAAWPNQRS